MKSKPKNKATIYWEQPSYSVVNTLELEPLPDDIKKMIVDALLQDLGIPIRII